MTAARPTWAAGLRRFQVGRARASGAGPRTRVRSARRASTHSIRPRCHSASAAGVGLHEQVHFEAGIPELGSGEPVLFVNGTGGPGASFARQTLNELGIDQVHAVGGSIGSLWVLRLAQAHPSRVERLVLLGGGPLTSEIRVPTFTRLLRSPPGEIITLEGSGGSIPLRITVKGDPTRPGAAAMTEVPV